MTSVFPLHNVTLALHQFILSLFTSTTSSLQLLLGSTCCDGASARLHIEIPCWSVDFMCTMCRYRSSFSCWRLTRAWWWNSLWVRVRAGRSRRIKMRWRIKMRKNATSEPSSWPWRRRWRRWCCRRGRRPSMRTERFLGEKQTWRLNRIKDIYFLL